MVNSEPWSTGDATDSIREMASHLSFGITYKLHATDQMKARDIITGDILYLLKHGYVYEDPKPAKTNGYFKYKVEGISPNSGGRKIGLIVIPDYKNCEIKLITVMWIDETSTRAGTITEEEI